MTASTSSLVHFYDTLTHRILCGVRGVDHHSTKHTRSVNCQACVSLLVKQRTYGTDAAVAHIAP